MKIFPSTNNPYFVQSKQPDIGNVNQPPEDSTKLQDPTDQNEEFGTPGFSTKEVLEDKEESLLHMLFGAEKPQEMVFYGRSKVNQIYKGQLLDVRG